MSRTTKVDFERPPINEVVCGALFKRVEAFKTSHFGLLWGMYSEEFPKTEDQPALLRLSGDSPNIDPTERRIWFVSEDDRSILQVQRDRFHFNWRRLKDDDVYPRFDVVYAAFCRHFEDFRSFLEQMGRLEIEQLELTYVNIIPMESASYSAVASVLPDLPWTPRASLLEPEGFQWVLEGPARANGGRLRIVGQSAVRRDDGRPVIRLELTVRGRPPGSDRQAMDGWFDAAHEAIVHGFVDLTAREAQDSQWRRQS